ncbi:MmgE/PrpD family protein [Pseudochelatococcus sp. B33]
MDSITRKAAEFVVGFDGAAVPAEALHAARIGFVDCVGVMLAGAREPAVGLVAGIATPAPGSNEAPMAVNGVRYGAPDAALVNGVAAHVLDFDDVALAGHPSTVLVPAILAGGHAVQASGRDAIEAYLVGYELWAHLAELESGHLHDRGFHPTAVMGTLATAAAAARLHRLSPEQTAHALAIAASLAAGLVANFGSMTKSLHAGRTAQSGILAARLARSGYTGSPDALEHRTGFLKAFSPSGAPELDPRAFRIGEEWMASRFGVNIKRYPTCYATHRAIDAMLDLVEEHDLAPEDIATIHVHTGVTQRLMLRSTRPQTGLAAKFSMEFAMASAAVARRVGLRELTDDFVSRADIQAMLGRVEVTVNEEKAGSDLPVAPYDLVWVTRTDGTVHRHAPVEHARGSWQLQLGREELAAKFLDCASLLLPEEGAKRLFDKLYRIEEIGNLRELDLA